MSVVNVNSIGTKISTKIRQAGFNPFDIEAVMYMGEETVPMFTHALKKSTWSQITWNSLGCVDRLDGGSEGESVFGINNNNVTTGNIDYLLAVAFETVFPTVSLVNTAAPVQYVTSFLSDELTDITVGDVLSNGEPLYFYLSDGTAGLPSGTVYVGTLSALTTSTINGGLGIPTSLVLPFISYAPRHRVGWGHHAVLAAFEQVTFGIDGVAYETLSRHALYNALQYRMREDIYPVAGHEATSLDAVLLPSGVGNGPTVTLGCNEEDRFRAFIAPFSFTTSALADRGENGKHKSSFPLLLACRNSPQIRATLIDDLRRLLVLEEEVLPEYGTQPIIFVATAAELLIGSAFFTDGTTVFEIQAGGFIATTTGVLLTSGVYTINDLTTGVNLTVSPNQPFTISGFGALYLEQTGEYLPITRTSDYCLKNPFCREFDYGCWICESKLCLSVRAKALGALVTELERGMMKADCRGRKWLYERYTYFEECNVCTGDKTSILVDEVPGQTKYGYTFAQNENSRLQGHFFNYTNDSEYQIIIDEDLLRPKWAFSGKDSICRLGTRIQGNQDEDHPSAFYRYVDNPLVAQRAPREHGLHIAPRYNNWINSIYPDGSINAGWAQPTVNVKTSQSALLSLEVSPHYRHCNTNTYNVQTIIVAWNMAVFELVSNQPHQC